jgi:hypothetical protein
MRQTPLAVALLVALTAACSDSPTIPGGTPSAALNADVATIAAAGFAEDVDAMAGLNGLPRAQLAGLVLPPTDPGNVAGCTYGGESWTCPNTRVNGLDVVRVITFRDASGAAQQLYNAETTASIEVAASIEGDVAGQTWSGSIDRERQLTWTGLEGTETQRTVNGQGSETVSRSRFTEGGETRGYDLVGSFSIVNVVMPVRGEGIDPWPLSGTITRTYTVTRSTGETVTRTVVITFDGTSSPTATVNGESFEIDLAARQARRR